MEDGGVGTFVEVTWIDVTDFAVACEHAKITLSMQDLPTLFCASG